MGMWAAVRRRFGHRDRPSATAPDIEVEIRLFALSEKLRMMRGNVTTPMEPRRSEPRRGDAVGQMNRAARDNRFVQRTIEDDVLKDVTEYRSIDDT